MEPKQAGPFAADKIELHPGAWERFRQAVHVMAKAGPQHRIGGAAVNDGAGRGRASGMKAERPMPLAGCVGFKRPASWVKITRVIGLPAAAQRAFKSLELLFPKWLPR
jgi:hypothetical protein